MRAGIEVDISKRELSTGAFRTVLVSSNHRGGARTVFVPADEVMTHVAELPRGLDALPDHPLVRAAWITQALGAIHPFHDSNGGTSRFFASLQLARAYLPPLVLTTAERNGSYIDGIMEANQTRRIDGLARLFATVVHRGLAETLLETGGAEAAWDPSTRAHAERWIPIIDRAWRAALGPSLATAVTTLGDALPSTLAHLARRGIRVPAAPSPQCARWSLAAPLPVQLEVVIVPVRAGAATWSLAVVTASIDSSGALGAAIHPEQSDLYFVAPAGEPDATVDARFERWLDRRIAQCVRGLAPWM